MLPATLQWLSAYILYLSGKRREYCVFVCQLPRIPLTNGHAISSINGCCFFFLLLNRMHALRIHALKMESARLTQPTILTTVNAKMSLLGSIAGKVIKRSVGL